MCSNTTWKTELEEEMEKHGERLDDLISCTMTTEEMLVEFYAGHGGEEGIPFTAWTEKRVYFPIMYDGAEWVGSVSRHPDGIPTEHKGG